MYLLYCITATDTDIAVVTMGTTAATETKDPKRKNEKITADGEIQNQNLYKEKKADTNWL